MSEPFIHGAGQPPRRVLIIAYEFPPLAAGGVARTVRFARYLPRFGWQPHVLSTSNPAESARDATLLKQLHPSTVVHRTRSWEHHAVREPLARLAALLGGDEVKWRDGLEWRLRGMWSALALPDHKIYWALPALLRGLYVILRHRIDAIYSTSWPYSDHVAGMILSKLTGRPLIVDLRDPWTRHMHYHAATPRIDRWQHRLERAVCEQARFVIAPAHDGARIQREVLPDQPRAKFVAIRNGYDPDDFAGPVDRLPGFEIVHAGTFYKSRQPTMLIDGFRRFLDRVPDARAHARFRFFGMSVGSGPKANAGEDVDQGSGRSVELPPEPRDSSRGPGREGRNAATVLPARTPALHSERAAHHSELISRGVEIHGWTPHTQVVQAMRESSVLVILRHQEPGVENTLPAKAFEYMAAGNHILSIQQPQREFDRILRAYRNATILREFHAEAFADALAALYGQWKTGELQRIADAGPPPFVRRFGRDVLTRMLAELLDRAIAGRRPVLGPFRATGFIPWSALGGKPLTRGVTGKPPAAPSAPAPPAVDESCVEVEAVGVVAK